jgi:hypothetical protein
VPFVIKNTCDKITNIGFVVDDENIRCHDASSVAG